MKLRDYLTNPEKDELRNVMRNWPVFAGDTISHATARSLSEKGLIFREKTGEWRPNWEAIRDWKAPRIVKEDKQ
jgi:hypothetical protein